MKNKKAKMWANEMIKIILDEKGAKLINKLEIINENDIITKSCKITIN